MNKRKNVSETMVLYSDFFRTEQEIISMNDCLHQPLVLNAVRLGGKC